MRLLLLKRSSQSAMEQQERGPEDKISPTQVSTVKVKTKSLRGFLLLEGFQPQEDASPGRVIYFLQVLEV